MNKKHLQNAIEQIVPIAQTLTHSEWTRISSIIGSFYTKKAAKVQLDGNDVIFLEENLRHEILGEPYCAKPQQQPE